jgi:uncharacterized protein involved in exopolysaccharide biosynthesis
VTHPGISGGESRSQSGPLASDAAVNWLARALGILIRMKTRVIAYLLVGALIAAGVGIAIPNQYSSSAAFIAQGSSSLGLPVALQSAAASLGLDRGNDYSPKFYADLLTSRPILRSAILHEYQLPGEDSSKRASYLQIEGFSDEPPTVAVEDAMKHLSRRIAASADVRTNMITVSVRARYPTLSRELTAQLLVALDSLNVGFRQYQSRESREFYETRVQQSRRELDSAEAAVERFLQQNRVTTSPALQFELQRLQREGELKRGLYGIVVQQYEQARLQEARNVPTLTVLADPFVPVKKSYPARRLIVVLGMMAGLAVLWIQITIAEALTRFRREEPEHWETLQRQIPVVRHLAGRR